MTQSTRCDLAQAGCYLSRLKAMHSNIQQSIKNYDIYANETLKTLVSAFYLDTRVHDMKLNRDGKLSADGTSLVFLFDDIDGKYKKLMVFDLNSESSKGNLADYPLLDPTDPDYTIKSFGQLLKKFEPIFTRFQVIVSYSSVWDAEGIISSEAYVNMATRKVTINQVYDPNDILDEDGDPFECNILAEEYIEFEDGTRKPCHNRFSVDEYNDSWDPNKDFWYD